MRISSLPSRFLGTAAVLSFPFILLAQQKPDFQAEVEVIHVLATVKDKKGQLVSDLTKEDFLLQDEGQGQAIEYFARQSDLPLTLGLLVDTSLSQRRILETQRKAGYQFFEQVLRPQDDLAFVISFDVEVELLEELTNSRQQLHKALSRLEVPPASPGRGSARSYTTRSFWRSRKSWRAKWGARRWSSSAMESMSAA